ncbi:MAG TPA: fibronectin type III domain-containing protein [Steroidobacteraceae bacterium]|nr:fibronectin type III domain-containing protein [Steroidobacteraceae bacterium]
MKALWPLLLALAPLARAGQWTAHPIIPFGPLAACNACTAIPGQLTITWDTPTIDDYGAPFTVDHYVMVYERIDAYDVSFIDGIPASATSYTLTGLTSGAVYAAWLLARGADGYTHTVTPWVKVTAP